MTYHRLLALVLVFIVLSSSCFWQSSSVCPLTSLAPPDPRFLGLAWLVEEDPHPSDRSIVWTRRGWSNIFDGVWKGAGARSVTAELHVTMQGDEVAIRRINGSDGVDYLYTGRFTAPGVAAGMFVEETGVYRGPWTARIEGGLNTVPPVPAFKPEAPWVDIPRTPQEARDHIQRVISGFDPNTPATLDSVHELTGVGHAGVPVLMEMLQSPNLMTRWAAAYGLSYIAETEDIPGLVSGLNDSSQCINAILGATLLRLGDERGLPALRQAANSQEQFLLSSPPRTRRDYAREVLSSYGWLGYHNAGYEGPGYSDTGIRWPDIISSEVAQPHVAVPAIFDSTARPGAAVAAAAVSGGQGSGRPSPPPAIPHVEAYNGGIRYVVYMEFYGPGISGKDARRLLDRWNGGIAKVWSGHLEWQPGAPMEVAANMKTRSETDSPTPGYQQIYVHNVKPGQPFRANALNWSNQDSDYTAAHEVGHLLGLCDEYVMTSNGSSEPRPEYVNDNEDQPSIMVQTWPSAIGLMPVAKPRHSRLIEDALYQVQGLDGPLRQPEQRTGTY